MVVPEKPRCDGFGQKKTVEVCRKAQFQCGRTKLMPPLWTSLALSPDSCYVRNMFVESLRGLTERTCQRFASCQKKRRPMDAGSVNGLGQAGDVGNTQRCSVPASPSSSSSLLPTSRQRGEAFFSVISITSQCGKGKKTPLWLCTSCSRLNLKAGVQ